MHQEQREFIEAIPIVQPTSISPGIGKENSILRRTSGELIAKVSNPLKELHLELRINLVESGYQVFLTPLGGGFPHLTFHSETCLQPTRDAAISKAWELFQKELHLEGFQLIDVSPDVLPNNIEMLKTIITAVQTQSTKREKYIDKIIGD